jgi:serine/threonine protein kinase
MTGGATRYEILELFGASLLGSYYKARDRELERLVLLWLLPPALFPDDGERRRCLSRAAAVAALHHPSLLPLYETGETGDGGIFQAFAWAEGETLARRLEAGPLKPAVAVDLTTQIAAGLALAHGQGIIHGHLDPSGVLVTSSGEAKLFDLSASPGERTWAGAGEAPVAAWRAPEQRQGLAADARSDVWGLGAMLYEMVTGMRPRSGGYEPLRALRPDASEDLERIVARALAPKPADRQASAGDLRRELAALARSGSRPVATTGSSPQPSGERIDHYRLLDLLGGGGMGVVYRAEDTRLGRTVALKLLPPELARDPVAKMRFFQEARTASALEHPNVCTVFDAGEADDGRLWIAMPCYDGETLRSRLERGPLPVDEGVDVARQVALGLAKAHRQGIVHRDIKPANLVLTGDGAVILDFGIAKLAGEARLTQTGMAIGTLGYMAPEQACGGEIDHRTDLWALGVVLYEMLAGRRPFPGENAAAVIEGILHREPEPLAKSRPEIPPALEEIVRKLLARSPAERPASAEEVAGALRSLAGPVSQSLARPRPGWRTGALWAGEGLAVILLLAGGWMWVRRPAGPQPDPVYARLTTQEGSELFPSLSPDGSFFGYAKEDGGDLDILFQHTGGSQPINLTADSPVDDTHPAFSPDGSQIVFRSEREGGGIFLMGATGESVTRLTRMGYDPAWSPDGRQIAFATQPVRDPSSREAKSQIWIMDVAGRQPRLLVPEDAVQPSWSPGGRRIAYWGVPAGTSRREIWTVDVDGREPILVTRDEGINWNPVWSPDGLHLYFSSDRGGSMNLWRIPADEVTGQVRGRPEPATLAASWSGFLHFSHDGRKILYATREKRTDLLKVELDPREAAVRGEPVQVSRGIREFSFASLSPDGAWVVLSSWGGQEDLFVQRSDGSGFRQITNDAAKDRAPVWMPDHQILFRSDRTGTWEAWAIRPDGSDLRPLTAGPGAPGSFVPSFLRMDAGSVSAWGSLGLPGSI